MKLKEDKAYSLIEVIIIVMIIGIFAVIAVPRLNFAAVSKYKAEAVARKIVTDLRLTRRLAISDAANNTMGYELKLIGPLPYTVYEIENIKTHETVATHTIDSDINIDSPTGIRFMFRPLGNLQLGSASLLTVSYQWKSFTINIIPATGAIKCTEN